MAGADAMTFGKPFQKGQGGRVKGARNKISQRFLEALLKDFEEHGEAAIKIMRHEKPNEYVKVIASILPKEFEITENKLAEIPDDELDYIIERTRTELRARVEHARDGEDETTH
jgi:hypothetical protein